MSTVVVPGFLPSQQGLHFANSFPAGPTVRVGRFAPTFGGVGNASRGLCGGMCFTVRDLFEHGVASPDDTEPPANGSPRFNAIVRRQVESLDWFRLPLRFWLLSARAAFGTDGPRLTFGNEWPHVRREIDEGRLAMLGLIRAAALNPAKLTSNHQVMAFGYAEDGRGVTLRLYDPNWPDRDDVTITILLDPGLRPTRIEQSTGEPMVAFFLASYKPAEPRAWRSGRVADAQVTDSTVVP